MGGEEFGHRSQESPISRGNVTPNFPPTNSAESEPHPPPAQSEGTASSALPAESSSEHKPQPRKKWVAVRAPVVKAASLAEAEQIAEMLPLLQDSRPLPHGTASRKDRRRLLASTLVSGLAHAVALIIFALWVIHFPSGLGTVNLVANFQRFGSEDLESDLVLEQAPQELVPEKPLLTLQPAEVTVPALEDRPAPGREGPPSEPTEPLDPGQPWGAGEPHWVRNLGRPTGGGLEGRNPDVRPKLVSAGGGSVQSERAVEQGLRWIAAHQATDGSWRFDLKVEGCYSRCRNPGSEPSTTAATGLALLPFLGAGYTHKEGPYMQTVERGLYYLLRRGRKTDHGLDFQEGMKNGMYAQGLVAIALCEAYAMTRDPALKDPAQEAIRFIEYAQDKSGGGWRYRPGEPGDTTVTGWQLMALKSAELAGLKVDRSVHYQAQRFLDSVAAEEGAVYGYQDRTPRPSTTAIGLLCRMYAGWPREHPPLARGIAHLAEWGPSESDLYYDYYAQQVMRHWGGSDWRRWNEKMREHLIRTQATEGHEAGTWYFEDPHARVGGRLYTTALAVMILEVYYRYMPLYGSDVFPEL